MQETSGGENAVPNPSVEQTANSNITPNEGSSQIKGEVPADIKAAARDAIRKHKVKVAGEEFEVDEDELKRGYSHNRAAAKTMQEATRLRKQAEDFISMMKDKGKLMEAIKKLGHDPRKLSEEYLSSVLEEELMDPKDRELKTTKARLREMEEMDRQQKEAVQKRRDEALKAKYSKDYTDQFVEALKTTQLPPTKHAVAEMAKYVYRAAEIGFKMSPQEAAQLVKEDFQKLVNSAVSESDGETLIKLLGEGVANKVRQWDTSRVKDPSENLKNTAKATGIRQTKDKSRRLTPAEWRAFNRK